MRLSSDSCRALTTLLAKSPDPPSRVLGFRVEGLGIM